jgi:hypothetical protein
MAEKLAAPRLPTLKRLFAVSGNQCAFPKCQQSLIDGETVTGKVCHIKGSKKGGARYDENQSNEDRHGFENLILLCGRHHDVIDDDEESYRVDRLHRMKATHESSAERIPDDEAERAAMLVINQQVSSVRQSGGITAHIVNVHNYGSHAPGHQEASSGPIPMTAKVGNGRFRFKDEPVGMHWNTLPFANDPGLEIFLNDGPLLWLRMRSIQGTDHDFDNVQLKRCASIANLPLQPLFWANFQYLRATDGMGAYNADDPVHLGSITTSVCFAFSHGEIWAADTTILGYGGKNLHFTEIAKVLATQFRGYAEYLSCLGLGSSFEWSAGIDDVKHWLLQIPAPAHHISTSLGHRCLEENVIAQGKYELGDSIPRTLMPFFNRLCRACATAIPKHLDQILTESGIR